MANLFARVARKFKGLEETQNCYKVEEDIEAQHSPAHIEPPESNFARECREWREGWQKLKPHLNPKTFARESYGKCRELFTYDALFGDVDYAHLFTPDLPCIKGKRIKGPVFFPLEAKLPIVLASILGFQHALSMMGGLVSVGLLLGSYANLDARDTTYLVSASLLGAGILTFFQVSRIRIPFTRLYIGTGMVSVLGQSFSCVAVVASTLPVMYSSGFCPTSEDGTKLPCPDAIGAFFATSSLCALFQILLACIPQRQLLNIFPPIVNGPVVMLIGVHLIESAMQDWAGGSGCVGEMCGNAVKQYKWGSGQWIGLGFSVFVTIVVCDKWGPPILKSCSIIAGLLIGCIIAAGAGYFDHKPIDAAPSGEFLWVRTYKLQLYGPIVLPLLAVFVVCLMESIGDISATAEISRLATRGPEFESRLQGGLLAAGLGSVFGGLMTLLPQSSFAQNNGVVAMTQCAARTSGYYAAGWLVLMGVIGKFSAAIVEIPNSVIGGMTAFLFTSVGVSGMRIISTVEFSRRDRVVLTIALMFGFSSLLVPHWFEGVFTYKGDDSGKKGFINAIIIVVQTPYAIAGVAGVLANLLFPEEPKDDVIEGVELEVLESMDPPPPPSPGAKTLRSVYGTQQSSKMQEAFSGNSKRPQSVYYS